MDRLPNGRIAPRQSPGSVVLRKLYVEDRRSIEWMLRHFRTYHACLKRWLDEAGIEIHEAGWGKRVVLDPATIRAMYVDQKMSLAEICAATGHSIRPVRRALRAARVRMRNTGPRDKAHGKQPVFDRIVDAAGYVKVRQPGHHRANNRGFVYEHILVAEQKLGRPILESEDVHHIDGNKANNSPENLGVFPSRGSHVRHHNLDRSSAKEFHSLTDDQVSRLYESMSTVQLAKQFGTSPASIQRDLNRRGIPMRAGRRKTVG